MCEYKTVQLPVSAENGRQSAAPQKGNKGDAANKETFYHVSYLIFLTEDGKPEKEQSRVSDLTKREEDGLNILIRFCINETFTIFMREWKPCEAGQGGVKHVVSMQYQIAKHITAEEYKKIKMIT